jgi:hypothetical protein
MARYTIETPSGKQLPVEDFMITDMGLEAVQVDKDDKVTMILFLGDGTIIYDHESGKTKDDVQKAKDEYRQTAEHQQKLFRERANEIIREAVEQGKHQDNPMVAASDPDDEDGEESQGPMIQVPKVDDDPAGYA